MSSKNCQGPSLNGRTRATNNARVEVIDHLVEEPRPTYGQQSQLDDVKAFKVFLKKNLPYERPAPDLLTKIHERIDELKE